MVSRYLFKVSHFAQTAASYSILFIPKIKSYRMVFIHVNVIQKGLDFGFLTGKLLLGCSWYQYPVLKTMQVILPIMGLPKLKAISLNLPWTILGDFPYSIQPHKIPLISPLVNVIKLFWRKSGNSRFSLKPQQQEQDILKEIKSF